MDEPIKVIHKYKNKNRKIQYNVLIFVGNLLNEQTNKVLKKIKDKNLYDCLTELNDRDLEILNKEYGSKWYKHFFIDKHIHHTFEKIIKNNESKKKEIIKKYGQDWYNTNVETYLEVSKIVYSYQSMFKFDKEEKIKNVKNKALIKDTESLSYKVESSSVAITNVESTGGANNNEKIITGKIINNPNTEQANLNSKSDEEYVNNVLNRLELQKSISQIIYNNSNSEEVSDSIVNVDAFDNKDKNLSKGSIPKILSDALAISFETNIGHSYFDDSDDI
jgi:hypothetical protein